jgi:hypothetical protein
MTEREWQRGTMPQPLLDFVLPSASKRKQRLFFCTIARRCLTPDCEPIFGELVGVAERFADAETHLAELERTQSQAKLATVITTTLPLLRRAGIIIFCTASDLTPSQDLNSAVSDAARAAPTAGTESLVQTDLLRDIFGTPSVRLCSTPRGRLTLQCHSRRRCTSRGTSARCPSSRTHFRTRAAPAMTS